MQFAVIENGTVVNIAESEIALEPNWVASETAAIGDIYENGASVKSAPPPKTPDAIREEVTAATQQRLDDFARTRNYDGILSACTYATSTLPRFAAEGQYAVQARDATWAALYALLADVQAGTRPVPASFDDVAPLLPPLEWPQ